MFIYLSMIDNEEYISKFECLYNKYKQLMFYIIYIRWIKVAF